MVGVGCRVYGVWWFPTVGMIRLSQPPAGDWPAGDWGELGKRRKKRKRQRQQ